MASEQDLRGNGWWRDSPWPRDRSFGLRWPVLGLLFALPMLVPAARSLLAADTSPGRMVLIVLAVGSYVGGYCAFPWLSIYRREPWAKVVFGAVMLALGWLVTTAVFGGTVYPLIYALGVVVIGLPPGWALTMSGATFAGLLVFAALRNGINDVGTLAGITSALFAMSRLVRTVRRLRAAHEEIATLAVNAERERLARDLHDILGHSLTTITVKAGLARRVLESANDTGRAIEEIREVEALSRSALSDVRATVSEYREVSLSAELVGARAALRAAEIDGDLPHAVDNVRPELQQVFGYVLREAVTNVLRHSGAKHVKVRLGKTWMEIEDDGVGAAPDATGNGLRGIAERLERVGGTLHTERGEHGGFVVRAQVRPALEAVS